MCANLLRKQLNGLETIFLYPYDCDYLKYNRLNGLQKAPKRARETVPPYESNLLFIHRKDTRIRPGDKNSCKINDLSSL